MRRAWNVFVVLALVAMAWGTYEVFLVGTCETPAPPGVKECSPEAVWHAGAMLLGIAAGVTAVFAFGQWAAFYGMFAAIGAGSFAAGLRPASAGGQRWYLAFGAVFLFGPVLQTVALGAVAAHRVRRHAEVADRGADAVATVLSVADTGVTVNTSPRVRLRVRIEPATGEPYESEQDRFVGRLAVPRPGDRLPVKVDPGDPHRWVDAEGPAIAFARRVTGRTSRTERRSLPS